MIHPVSTLQRQELRFGSFRLYPERRLLLADGQQVRIGNRAFDILLALVDSAGEVVTKEELIAAAWPDTVVEDINLRVHIAALRRALGGNRYIVNVVGRGYAFVGDIDTANVADTRPDAATPPGPSNLPTALTRMIGRDALIESLALLLPERRLLTIVGTGGVGKSRLALAIATRVCEDFAHGAHFVDLAAITGAGNVPKSLATVIGLTIPTSDPLPDLLAFLQHKHMLLVIDNCEHVIEAAAALCERILKSAAGVAILATSREPLGAEGEWLHRLAPLEVPHARKTVDAARATAFDAVQLFVERARTQAQSFELTDANANAVGDICRRLDGIPLAIELAVSRLNLFGIEGLAARLDDHFLLVAQGRRTAAPRHQTLRATLDWSYQLLSDTEQRVLRRLAVFNGSFAIESALAVAAHGWTTATGAPYTPEAQEIFESVMSLADKSLLATESSGDIVHHRLLHTTRAFALEKLAASAEREQALHWHAEHHRELLRQAETAWETLPKAAWVATYAYAVDDLRAALDWAFSESGDALLGAELTVAATPFGFHLALMDEFRDRVELALRRLATVPEPQPVLVSQLEAALQVLAWNTQGMAPDFVENVEAIGMRAQHIGIASYQIEPLVNETVSYIEVGQYAAAVATSERLQAVAASTGDPLAVLIGERALAQAQHFLGRHGAARALALRVLEHPAKTIPLHYHRLAVDRRVSMRIVLARSLWLEGQPDQALRMVEECLDHALPDTPFAICQALALAACPIALWCGAIELAGRYIRQLLDATGRYRIEHWQDYGHCYAHALEGAAPTRPLSAGHKLDTLVTIAPASVGAGLSLLQPLLAFADPGMAAEAAARLDSWCLPELLRVLGEQQLQAGAELRAERLFLRAIEHAQRQRSLSWELRAATSLARLWTRQGESARARDLLAPVHGRYTEGHATRDLRAAAVLLGSL